MIDFENIDECRKLFDKSMGLLLGVVDMNEVCFPLKKAVDEIIQDNKRLKRMFDERISKSRIDEELDDLFTDKYLEPATNIKEISTARLAYWAINESRLFRAAMFPLLPYKDVISPCELERLLVKRAIYVEYINRTWNNR